MSYEMVSGTAAKFGKAAGVKLMASIGETADTIISSVGIKYYLLLIGAPAEV